MKSGNHGSARLTPSHTLTKSLASTPEVSLPPGDARLTANTSIPAMSPTPPARFSLRQSASLRARAVRFFFMYVSSFVAVVVYLRLYDASKYSALNVRSALLTALIGESAYVALAYRRHEGRYFDFMIWSMFPPDLEAERELLRKRVAYGACRSRLLILVCNQRKHMRLGVSMRSLSKLMFTWVMVSFGLLCDGCQSTVQIVTPLVIPSAMRR